MHGLTWPTKRGHVAHADVSGKNTKNNQQIVEIKISQEPGRRKTGTKLIYL